VVFGGFVEQTLIRLKQSQVQAYQELKSVIISDAVTGKIDVRNITVPEYEHVDDISDDDNEDGEEIETDGEED
jgi:type I restriction enzyme S subunit